LKVWLKRTLYFFIILFICLIVAVFMALQSAPHIQPKHQISANSAIENKRIAQRLVQTLKSNNKPILLKATQAELNGLSAFSHRAFPQLISDVTLLNDSAFINLSLALPLPEMIKYLNIEVMLNTSKQGIDLDTVYIGSLALPGNGLIKIIEWLTNSYIKEEFGTSLLNMVGNVDISQNHIMVGITFPENLQSNKRSTKEELFALRDQLAIFGDVEVIRFYHQSLIDFIDTTQAPKHSMVEYLRFVFGLAQQRNLAGVSDSLIEENRAALTALVLYFGTDKFELLVGDISNFSVNQSKQRVQLQASVKLRNRVDIQKHFIYSVALQLFGTSAASNAIGELKEFSDSNNGGSGFSFADLMADRAGTRLAMLATDSEESALKTQNHLAKLSNEAQLLPELIGLPEGITQKKFEQYYRDIDSLVYQSMLFTIDRRLQKIAVYQE